MFNHMDRFRTGSPLPQGHFTVAPWGLRRIAPHHPSVEGPNYVKVELDPVTQTARYFNPYPAGRQVEPRNVYRSFTRVAESAGLRVIRLHDARHGTATLLTAAGVAPRVVMEILGHSQISITMDVYTHVVQDTQREAISHMDRLLKRRPVASDRPR
ncbi:tyrosine-type recombinase/integrase [Streptomyces sp. SID5476]|uniref:Phage integrase n=1 Tax=Streptomyces bottropensis ATCC 25435 TaxID=1054862 RepID=M3FDM5_9ACTN|nr:phage integrase [Streptomyces bottropensis ATCC 25435]MZD21263.1 tyrosine-type recombinase/integrase [Streptomyces sp. SID5476]